MPYSFKQRLLYNERRYKVYDSLNYCVGTFRLEYPDFTRSNKVEIIICHKYTQSSHPCASTVSFPKHIIAVINLCNCLFLFCPFLSPTRTNIRTMNTHTHSPNPNYTQSIPTRYLRKQRNPYGTTEMENTHR